MLASAHPVLSIVVSWDERTACPKCSVLVPQGSTNCTFCGEVWGKDENIAFTNPFSQDEENEKKEIIPRTGEILIGTNVDRWKIDVGACGPGSESEKRPKSHRASHFT